MSEPLKLISYL